MIVSKEIKKILKDYTIGREFDIDNYLQSITKRFMCHINHNNLLVFESYKISIKIKAIKTGVLTTVYYHQDNTKDAIKFNNNNLSTLLNCLIYYENNSK